MVISALVQFINTLLPSYILAIFKFAFLSLIIEITFNNIYDIIWMRKLSVLNTEIANKKLFYKYSKSMCISDANSEYFKKHNNFIVELIYFLFTTTIVFIGMLLKDNNLILLFFLIRTGRRLIVIYKINNLGLSNFYKFGVDEDRVYYELYLSCEDTFIDFFNNKEVSTSDELFLLKLKFKELIKNNRLNKDIIVTLFNSEQITNKTIDMINSEYSKLINK